MNATEERASESDADFEAELSRSLSKEMEKVVRLKTGRTERYVAPHPEDELEQIAHTHHIAIARRQKRIVETMKMTKATISSLNAQLKQEKKRHDNEVDRLNALILEAREAGDRDVTADKRLIASSRAALTELVD